MCFSVSWNQPFMMSLLVELKDCSRQVNTSTLHIIYNKSRVANVSSQVLTLTDQRSKMKETITMGTFPPCTSTNKCQQKTCGVTNKRLHTVFVLSSCGVILWAAKVKHAPDLWRRLQFVMLVPCLLSISLSRCLPLCCLSNTSTSSLICFFVQWELTPDSVTSLHALGCPKVSHWKVWPIDDHSLKTNYWFLFVLFCCFYIKLYLTKYQD